MSIAWTTVAILTLLLPGFVFFVGLNVPQRFSRESVPRTPFGQLAAVLFVSILVHFALISVTQAIRSLPHVDLRIVLSALQAGPEPIKVSDLANNLRANLGWVVAYLLLSSVLGFFAGWIVCHASLNWGLGFVHEHRWVNELQPQKERPIVAYVATTLQHERQVALYQGFLEQFGVRQDGTLAYVVLRQVYDRYLDIGETPSPKVTPRPSKPIGEVTEGTKHYLYIGGDQISNAFFRQVLLDNPEDVPVPEEAPGPEGEQRSETPLSESAPSRG